ncbi:MAG: hypothetical protein J5696_05395 [Lachnospiraceae bacterium]|nr:hypothetical protein [Lachnospiraceae bacterium]
MDPSTRAKYDITYVRSFLRPDANERKESPLTTILAIIGFLGVMFGWTLMFTPIPPVIWVPLLILTIIICFAYVLIDSNNDAIDGIMDCSFLMEFLMHDKETREEHPGYVFVEGYNNLNSNTASVIAMNTSDGFKTPKGRQRERAMIEGAVKNQRKTNAKEFSKMIHDDEFQKKVAEAIITNQKFPDGMNYIYFEKYHRLKKKGRGRYYAIPGNRGLEKKILIPSDCGFDK